MKKELKVAIVGSGSTYTPELIEGFINFYNTLPITKLSLMDINDRKRTIVGNLCKRMFEAKNIPCQVEMTDDLDTAIKDADFVISQIRVGGMAARINDESIPLKYDLLGQETTGIGGFMCAQRTIPVAINIANRMKELAPNAFLINFTNPAGIVTEAIQKSGFDKVIGLCNVPLNMVTSISSQLETEDLQVEYLGLNHFSWITKMIADGKDVTQKAFDMGVKSEVMKNIVGTEIDSDILHAIGGIYSPYLEYFYARKDKIEHLKSDAQGRGQLCKEVEESLLELYSKEEICEKPELLNKRGGHLYSLVAVSLINAIHNDSGEVQIVNVKNNGTLSFLKDDDVVEVACKIDKNGATPVEITSTPTSHIVTMMQCVKEYERQAVKAGNTGDINSAHSALLTHPLLGDYQTLKECLNEMLEVNKEYLPQYF